MGARAADPVGSALRIFLEVREEVEKAELEKAEELGSKLRSRAREVAELIDEVGLVPTLSFLYSKKHTDEWKACRLVLKAVLDYLGELKVINRKVDEWDKDPQAAAEDLLKLLNMSRALTPLLRPFFIEFKRLCEASWKPERGAR